VVASQSIMFVVGTPDPRPWEFGHDHAFNSLHTCLFIDYTDPMAAVLHVTSTDKTPRKNMMLEHSVSHGNTTCIVY
jgi:hypothetical protein